MRKIFLLLPFIFILNCSFDKVAKHHGVQFLDKKHDNLVINQTNKNDIINLLGKPSTKSTFDNDVWIYIERKTSVGSIFKLGTKELLVNNVLVLEINKMGLLSSKKFYDKQSMNDIKIAVNQTDPVYGKRSFVYDFLSSMRQKINDPLGNRAKRMKDN